MNCRNCEFENPQSSNYCAHCGEALVSKRLSIPVILSNFFNEFLNYDNKILKTFRHLFVKPEVVIESYIAGFRKKYVNAITYLSISLTLIAIQIFVMKTFFIELLASPNPLEVDGNRLADINAILFDYQGLISVFTAPLAAFCSWVAFLDHKYNVAEHVVINIYPTAQFYICWFFFTSVIIGFGLNFQIASLLTVPLLTIYMAYIFKRLFKLDWFNSIVRTLAYMVLYTILIFAVMFVVGICLGIYLKLSG